MERIKKHINDIGKFKQSLNNNDNVHPNPRQVEATADWLVDKLGSPGSRSFYCLVAMHISRGHIDYLVATALEKGRHPAKLFNWLARQWMKEHGIIE